MVDPRSVLTLLVKKGPCEGRTLQRRTGAVALRVGRVAKGNDLSVRDAGASQRHLSVEFLPPPAARWAVTDLGSSNGTLLNGTPLVPTVPAPLSDGDLIKIGESTVIAVSISIDADPGPAAQALQGLGVPRATQRPWRRRRRKRNRALRFRAGPDGGRPVRRKPPEVGNEVEEEAALPTRRGGRNKAVEPAVVEMEEEEEAAAIPPPRRGRSRKAAATVVLPPQPQNTRSARAVARRGEAVGSQNDEGKVVSTGRGRGRVTRASARNGTGGTPEEEEGEVVVARDREGSAAEGRGDEEEDMVETTDRTSNASEVVLAAGRGRAKRSRRGRGRATRASTTNAEDAIVENDENEQEERDMADGRERGGSPLRVLAVNDGSEEDKVATEDDKLDGISKASMEDEKMVDVEEDVTLTERAIEGWVDAQPAPADNGGVEEEEMKNFSKGGETEVDQELREKVLPESKLDGVGEVEENDKREAVGASGEKGHVGERTGRHRLENMTLGEWFVQIEKYLLAKNKEAAEKAIAEVQEKHRRFCEHVKTLKKSPAP